MPPIGGGGGIAYSGSRNSPLYADWPLYGTDPNDDYWRESATIVNRSWHLYRNDPYARAIVECFTLGTLGASGLTPRSLFQEDEDPQTSDNERTARRAINASLKAAYAGKRFDATGQLSRREMSVVMLISMIVAGDAFAVRLWKPDRPGRQYQATCWRIVDSQRISNQGWGPNNDERYEGLKLNADGVPIGVWIQKRHPYSVQQQELSWEYVPMYAADGTRNVVHLKAPGRADQLRGMGWFAPVMGLMKQLGGVTDAYVVAKRLQASIGLIYEMDDPQPGMSNESKGALLSQNSKIVPGMMKGIRRGDKIYPLNWNFQGADHQQFVDTVLRPLCASQGLPLELVMCRLSQASLASARASLMAAYRTFHGVQEIMIGGIEQPFAESVVMEDVARGRLQLSSDDLDKVFSFHFSRPSKQFPDPVREATAAKMWADMGKSPTTLMSEQGLEMEQEVIQSHQDRAFYAAQGVPLNTGTGGTTAPAGNDGGAPDSIDGQDVPAGQTDDSAAQPTPADVPSTDATSEVAP